MVLEGIMGGMGGLMGLAGPIFMMLISVVITGIVIVIGFKLKEYFMDYPFRVIILAVRSSGFDIFEDKLGIFYNKEEGRRYSRFRGSKKEMKAIPLDKIESDIKSFGKIIVIKKSDEEFEPLNSEKLKKMIEEGTLEPLVKDDVRFAFMQNMRRDLDLFVKKDFFEKWGVIISLFTLGIMIFLVFIAMTGFTEKIFQSTAQFNEAAKNELAAKEFEARTAEINLLIYSLEKNVTYMNELNYTNIFKYTNISSINFREKTVR